MCVKKPSLVPGRFHTRPIVASVSRIVVGSVNTSAPGGELRISASASTNANNPSEAALAKANVQPDPCRIIRNGTAERICPDCPSKPVNCDTMGTRRLSNHCGTRRSTEMNVRASPTPTSARAPTATGRDSVVASTSCAITINRAPSAIILREPTRSRIAPAGICIPA